MTISKKILVLTPALFLLPALGCDRDPKSIGTEFSDTSQDSNADSNADGSNNDGSQDPTGTNDDPNNSDKQSDNEDPTKDGEISEDRLPVDPDEECEKGDVEFTECVKCLCTDEGWECEDFCEETVTENSKNSKDTKDSESDSSCEDGDTKKDDCNSCVCLNDSWLCTEKACEYDPCSDKTCGETCTQCDPEDEDCVELAVVNYCSQAGTCTPKEPTCEYDPCGGKECGESCTQCDPKDVECIEPLVINYCSDKGKCSTEYPICEGTGDIKECTDKDPSDAVEISSSTLKDKYIAVPVSFGGGCEDHDLGYCLLEEEAGPQGRTLTVGISHDAHDDPCEAWLTEEVLIPYSDLGVYPGLDNSNSDAKKLVQPTSVTVHIATMNGKVQDTVYF